MLSRTSQSQRDEDWMLLYEKGPTVLKFIEKKRIVIIWGVVDKRNISLFVFRIFV